MAYNEALGARIALILSDQFIEFIEKKMFGGLAFMINDKMCVGIIKDSLMLRVMDDQYEKVLKLKHADIMQFTGKPMKGFVLIDPEGLKTQPQLKKWIDYGLEFGKHGVVKSKKKKS